jgi:hypothetical protein
MSLSIPFSIFLSLRAALKACSAPCYQVVLTACTRIENIVVGVGGIVRTASVFGIIRIPSAGIPTESSRHFVYIYDGYGALHMKPYAPSASCSCKLGAGESEQTYSNCAANIPSGVAFLFTTLASSMSKSHAANAIVISMFVGYFISQVCLIN